MEDFFEIARSRGFLTKQGVGGLSARKSKLLDFATEAAFSLPMQHHGGNPGFGYMANTAMSGGYFPCSDVACRVERVDHLARFAALYADHVVVRNPFSKYSHRLPVDLVRARLAGDLAVLQHLEPLIQRGIVTVTPPVIALCKSCARLFEAERERLTDALDQAGDRVRGRFAGRIAFTRDGPDSILIEGPPELVSHGAQIFVIPKTSELRGRLTPRRKEALLMALVTPMLEDIFVHRVHSRHTSLNYLSDRSLDIGIIRTLGGPKIGAIDRALEKGLAHAVPVVANAPISDILAVRDAESEAFQVYRHAVSKVMREADLTNDESIQEAFETHIQPELAGLDLAVRNARKLSGRNLSTEAGVSVGAVSVGMLVGAVQPAFGAVLAALGGMNVVRTLGRTMVDMVAEPSVVRENSFYFLWKLSRKSRKKFIGLSR